MKGYLTIFLAMSLSLLSGFILMLTGNAIRNGVKVRYECAVDTGMNAVLSEYNASLLEKYDLIYVDASYLEKRPSISNVEERLEYYVTENTSEILGKKNAPWGEMALDDVTIPYFETAAASLGASMRNQAVCYVEDTGVFGSEREVFGQMDEIRELNAASPMEDWGNVMGELAGMELPKVLNEEEEWEEVPLSNPADWVYGLAASDVLFLARVNLSTVNPAKVSLREYISHRRVENIASTNRVYRKDEDLFLSYLFDKMGCLRNPREDSLLVCQLEYIAEGENSDRANVKAVAEQLFRFRFADNAERALSDGNLRAQAMAIAAALQVVQLNVSFQKPVAESILYACAFLESIGDVRTIYEGGSIPVRKSGHSMSVSHILDGSLYSVNGDGGWSYEQYLASMILLTGEEEINMRAMDIMEMDIRLHDGNDNFKMDWCIERYEADISAHSYGNSYFLKRKYGYF